MHLHKSQAAELLHGQITNSNKLRQNVVHRAAMRMRSQSMSRVFYAWYDYFAELKRQREVSERMLRRMLNQKLHSMFNSWRLNVIEMKRQRTAIQRVAARIRLHSRLNAFIAGLTLCILFAY